MDISVFVRGAVIGLSVAAPVGPIGALCIRRTLAGGRMMGLVSGLGAATADAIYGFVAAFGITFLINLLISDLSQLVIKSIGGVFLIYLGVKVFRSRVSMEAAGQNVSSLRRAYLSTLFLTLTNPATIVLYAGIFAGLDIGATSGDYATASLMVLGVFSGSLLWWTILSTTLGWLRQRLDANVLQVVNWVSGMIIIGFGIVSLWTLIVPAVTAAAR